MRQNWRHHLTANPARIQQKLLRQPGRRIIGSLPAGLRYQRFRRDLKGRGIDTPCDILGFSCMVQAGLFPFGYASESAVDPFGTVPTRQ